MLSNTLYIDTFAWLCQYCCTNQCAGPHTATVVHPCHYSAALKGNSTLALVNMSSLCRAAWEYVDASEFTRVALKAQT